jgi:predicted chitinase
VDGIDVFLDSTGEGLGSRSTSEGAASAELSATPAIPKPGLQDELDAILALVPRACRANAAWAVPLLLDTARAGGITHLRRIAYLLATAQHASQFGAQLIETGNSHGHEGADRFFDRYEPGAPLAAALGNVAPGDGARFRGRGFVHIKGRAQYATWSQRLGMRDELIDGIAVPFLVAHPAAMARPDIAAQTLVRGLRDGIFTGIALGYYVNDKKTDYYNAHRVIDTSVHAREVAETAFAFATAIERLHAARHHAQMQRLATNRAAKNAQRDFMQEVRDAVERLAARGEIMPPPVTVIEWNGEARQGKFVQLDEHTCALHMGRGTYVRLDIQRDLNGIVPCEARNMALKRSGDVRPALRHPGVDFWR